jgi:hypothetical protein
MDDNVICRCSQCDCAIQYGEEMNVLRNTMEPWCVDCAIRSEEYDPSDFIWCESQYLKHILQLPDRYRLM